MRRCYAVLLIFVCLAVAVQAEEPKKKGKWYDIFRGPPTLASQEQQLRREQFELYKKQVEGELSSGFQERVVEHLQTLSDHLEKHRKAIVLLLEGYQDLQEHVYGQASLTQDTRKQGENIQNWAGWNFTVYDPDNAWVQVGGVYIFAGITEGRWNPYYIGETKDFSQRIPGHEQWEKARRLGATHIHSRIEPRTSERRDLERFLIQEFQPTLNKEYR